MKLHELSPKVRKSSSRKGRGSGSNKGTFSGRGCKGQNSRAGGGVRLGFEGGQTTFLQRMPKNRGFKNPSRVEAQVVNLSALEEKFKDGETVSFDSLLEKKLISKGNTKVKILGDGECKKKLKIEEGILLSVSVKKALGVKEEKISKEEKAEGKVEEKEAE